LLPFVPVSPKARDECGALRKMRGTLGQRVRRNAHDHYQFCSCAREVYCPSMYAFLLIFQHVRKICKTCNQLISKHALKAPPIEFTPQYTDYKSVGTYRKFSGDNASTPMRVYFFLWHLKLRVGKKSAGPDRVVAPHEVRSDPALTHVHGGGCPRACGVGTAVQSLGVSVTEKVAQDNRLTQRARCLTCLPSRLPCVKALAEQPSRR